MVDEAKEREKKILIVGTWNGRIGNDTGKTIGSMRGQVLEITINRYRKKILEYCITNDREYFCAIK